MAILESNTDLDVKGRVLATTVPNSTGSIVTWNASTKVFGLRSNAQIISDLGLQSSLTAGNHIDITSNTISVKPTLNTWIEDSGNNNRILMSTVSTGTNHNDMILKQISSDGYFKLRNAQDDDFFVYKNNTQELMMPLVGTSSSTVSNILMLGSNGTIWKSNRTIGDLIQNLSNGSVAGEVNISGGGTSVTLRDLNTVNLPDFDDTSLVNTGFTPIYNTTGSVGFPSVTGQGILSLRAANTRGSFALWKSNDNGRSLYVNTGSTTGWQGWEPIITPSNISTHISPIIDDIEIGGRNLLLNSNAYVDNGVTDVVSGVNFRRVGYAWSYNYNITLPKGTYTFSILAYNPHNVVSQARASFGGVYSYVEMQPNEVKLITRTITFTQEYSGVNYILTNAAFDPIAYSYIKIEKGNKPTDWTPAPEDQVSDWNETNSNSYSFIKNKPTIPTSSDFITTNTNQTGLSGDKTTSGWWRFEPTTTYAPVTGVPFGTIITRSNNGSVILGFDANGDRVYSLRGYATSNIQLELSSGGVQSTGFYKAGQNDTQMLLAGGGHRPVSDFALASSIVTPNNGLLTISTSSDLTGGGTFSADQATASNVNIGLSATTLSNIQLGVTANSLVINGGISRTSQLLNNSDDLDLIVEPGYYHHNSNSAPLNTPTSGAGYLEVVNIGSTSSFSRQTWRARNSRLEYQRTRNGAGVWSVWVVYYNSDNFTPSDYATVAQLSGFVPTSRTITINGTTFDLSANRTWNIPDNDTITRLRGTTSGTYTSGDLTLVAGANTTITQSGATITIASTNTNTTYSGSTSIILSGTSFQRAALTGDVTASQNSNATTIANGVVTNAKLANMGIGIKGRNTGTGAPLDLTVAQVQAMLGVTTVNDGSFTVQGTGSLTGSGSTSANASANTSATLDLTTAEKNRIQQGVDAYAVIPSLVDGVDYHHLNTGGHVPIEKKKTIVNIPAGSLGYTINVDDALYDGYELAINGCGEWSVTVNGSIMDKCGDTDSITLGWDQGGSVLFWWSVDLGMWVQAI